ncbi:MAG: hypothetical protein Q8R92_06920 [Deltaproteobacteria bacterium]|nr:hypothetical protein [Deltaproteobacteria bacterium]
MILACLECGKRYRTDPGRIPRGGGYVRCPGCKARIPVQAAPTSEQAAEAAPEATLPESPREAPGDPDDGGGAAAGAESEGVLHLLAEEGLLAARDLDEVHEWIFEGRIWPDNLVFVPGKEALRADTHPLTRDLFTRARDEAEESEEKAEAPTIGATAVSGTAAAELLAQPWPEEATGTDAETETVHRPAALPAGVRAFGVVNLLLSLALPPNPLGLVAAVGLLRGQAWGRTHTTAWAGLELLFLLVIWSGVTALLLARGTPFSLDPGTRGIGVLLEPPVLAVLAFGALGAYLVVQWSYLSRPDIASRFGGGGERAALWAGWIIGWACLSAIALATLIVVPRLESWGPFSQYIEKPPAPPPVAAPAPPATAEDLRIYAEDGLVSIQVEPRWTVTSVKAGPDERLGLLLQGSRENPAGTLRVSTARPEDVDRMNRRFDKIEGDQRTIQSVEDVAIGDLMGRRIVLSSQLRGGVTGQVLLSLHDEERGYQFSCAATGPGFDQIQAECDRMAGSLLIVRSSSAPDAGAGAQPAPAVP